MICRVGVFDSGIGGLTVLKELQRFCPDAEFLYYGDNLRAPYGSRSAAEICAFTEEGVGELVKGGAEAVVLACNTATAVCVEALRKKYSFPVIGTEPAVRLAARRVKSALILATPRTAESARLQRLIGENPACAFTIFPAAHLAAAIEEAVRGGRAVTLSEHLPAGQYGGVVLGCTHYVFLKRKIAEYYGVTTFDGNEGVARRLVALLKGSDWESGGKNGGKLGRLTTYGFRGFSDGSPARKVLFLPPTGQYNAEIYKRMF